MKMRKNQENLQAILLAVLACSFWGISFVAPHALSHVEASAISFFRFFFFGVSSAVALALRRKRLPKVNWQHLGWKRATRFVGEAVVLACSGYSVYYFFLSVGVKGIGAPFATAIIGLLPLTILLASNPVGGRRSYLLPAILLFFGAVLVPAELFSHGYGEILGTTPSERVLGLLASVAALALWTFFAVRNASFLRAHPEWRSLEWSGVLGVLAGLTSAVFFFVDSGAEGFVDALGDRRLLAWTVFMGMIGAWVATALWNRASRVLSGAVVGQLLVFEAAFGLLYAFLYDGRLPRPIELVSIVALMGGAILAMRRLLQAGR